MDDSPYYSPLVEELDSEDEYTPASPLVDSGSEDEYTPAVLFSDSDSEAG